MTALKLAFAAAVLALGAGSAFAAPSAPTIFGHAVAAPAETQKAVVVEGRSSAEPALLGRASEPTIFGHRAAR